MMTVSSEVTRPWILFGDSDRALHIRSVVRLAEYLDRRLALGGDLRRAACYHDIGYADVASVTGFHPVDGALLARRHGLPHIVAEAILHHTGAFHEMRAHRSDLATYYGASCKMLDSLVSRALTFCDLRSGVSGGLVSAQHRIEDIRRRHHRNSAILTSLDASEVAFHQIDAELSPALCGYEDVPLLFPIDKKGNSAAVALS